MDKMKVPAAADADADNIAQAEADSFNLPQLQNGVMVIGDLWDANLAARPGFNIFGNAFHPTGGLLSYNTIGFKHTSLRHSKETGDSLQDLEMNAAVTAELLGGFIKVAGGLEFQTTNGQGFDMESVVWHYGQSTFGVMPKAPSMVDMREHLDPDIAAKIMAGSIHATHFVSALTLGADATGSISIRQTNHSTKYRVKIFLEGSINLILLSAELGASAEISEEVKVANYEKVIKLNAVPAVPRPPVSLEQFENLGVRLDAEVVKTVYAEGGGPKGENVTGIPRIFVLYPIEALLEGLEGARARAFQGSRHVRVHRAIRTPFQDEFITVLRSLHDFDARDFCKRLLLAQRPLLLKIMGDAGQALTRAVSAHEKELRAKAKEYRDKMYGLYVEWKHDYDAWEDATRQELVAFGKEALFDMRALQNKLGAWIADGNKIIELVRIDDKDQSSPLHLFSSIGELGSWLTTERDVKVLLHCTTMERLQSLSRATGCEREFDVQKISNFPRGLQKVSKSLGRHGSSVGVAYPSASEDTGSPSAPVTLNIKTRHGQIMYEGEEDTEFVLEVLSGVTGHTEDGSRPIGLVFHNLYAEQLGISLPLPSGGTSAMRIENLPEFVGFLAGSTRHVTVYQDVASFQTAGRAFEGRWRFLAAIEALDSIKHSLHALELVQKVFQASDHRDDYELAVCNFELGANAPILFVFNGSQSQQLVAICTDLLDVLVLAHELTKDEGAEPTLVTLEALDPVSICMYSIAPLPTLVFAKQASERYGFGVTVPDYPHTNSPVHCDPAAEHDNDPSSVLRRIVVQHALKMARCVLDEPRVQLVSFSTSFVLIIGEMFQLASASTFPPSDVGRAFQALLEDSGTRWWSVTRPEVVSGHWESMLADLATFLQEHYGYLALIQRALLFLNGLAAEIDPITDPEEPGLPEPVEPDPEPETRRPDDILEILTEILEHDETSLVLRREIEAFMVLRHHIRVQAGFLAYAVKQEAGSLLQQPTPMAMAWVYYLQLLKLVEDAQYSEDGSTLPRPVQEDLVAQFVLLIASGSTTAYGPESQIETSLALSSRSYYALVTALSSLSLTPIHNTLVKGVAKIPGLDSSSSPLQVVKLLQAIWKHFHGPESASATAEDALEFTFLSYLWRNTRFVYMMLQYIDDSLVLSALVTFQCKKPNIVPKYIPKPFVGPLKAFMDADSGAGLGYPVEWPDLATALLGFQVIWTRGMIPRQFPVWLLRNMVKYAKFKSELLNAVGNETERVYWNEELQLFEQPWDLDTIYRCIDAAMNNDQIKEGVAIKSSAVWTLQPGRAKDNASNIGDEKVIRTLWEVRPLNQLPEGKETGSKQEIHEFLIWWFQRLNFGLPPFYPNEELGLGRFQVLRQFVNWAHESGSWTGIREVAHALDRQGLAIPLVVPTLEEGRMQIVLGPAYRGLGLCLASERNNIDKVANFLFDDTFRMVTVLGIGTEEKGRHSAWLLNTFYLKRDKETFTTGTGMDGYTELCRLDSTAEEVKLLANVHGDLSADKGDNALNATLQWLQRLSTKFVVFWYCHAWSLAEFKEKRQEFLEAAFGGQSRNVLELCVNPSPEIVDGLSVHPRNLEQIIYLDNYDTKTEAKRIIARVLSAALGSGRRRGVTAADLGIPPSHPNLQPFKMPATIEEHAVKLANFVESHTVKSVKSTFIPLGGGNVRQIDLEAHWKAEPVYATTMELFLDLLAGEAELEHGHGHEGMRYLERALDHHSNDAPETRRLQKQRRVLEALLASEQSEEKRKLLRGELRRTSCTIEHEYCLSVPQLFDQLLYIYETCPKLLAHLIHGKYTVPMLIAHAFLGGAAVDLPTSGSEIIEPGSWYKEFMGYTESSGNNNFFVISFVGGRGASADPERNSIVQKLFAPQKSMHVTATSPHSSLRLRLAPVSEEFQDQVYATTGTRFGALLLVDTPDLDSDAGAEGAKKLVAALLATSHLTIVVDPQSQETEHDVSFMDDLLEGAFLDRLGLPPAFAETCPQPNVLFMTRGPKKDARIDFGSILQDVYTLVQKYPLETGLQAEFWSTFRTLERKAALDEVVHVYGGSEPSNSTTLYEKILGEVLNTEHAGQSLQAWAENVRHAWTLISDSNPQPLPGDDDEEHFELIKKLHQVGALIHKAVEHHLQGYKKVVAQEMALARPPPEIDNSGSGSGFDGAIEDEMRPAVVRASIQAWAKARLSGVYNVCDYGDGDGDGDACEFCEAVAAREMELLAEYGQSEGNQTLILETLAKHLDQARATGMQRVEQIGLCEELAVNQRDLAAEFEFEKERAGVADLTWIQFLSTRLVLVGTWTRFFAEIRDVFPAGFVTHFGLSAYAPLEANDNHPILSRRENINFKTAIADNENEDNLNWERYQLLFKGLKGLAQKILRPSSSAVDDLHYSFGHVYQLRESVDQLIKEVIHVPSPEEPSNPSDLYKNDEDLGGGLDPLFAWNLHHAALQHLWGYVVKYEADWSTRYNPLTYDQIQLIY